MMKEHENMKRFRTFRPLARKRLWCLFACHMLLFSNFTFSQETMDTDKEKTKELDLSFQKINWDEFNGSAYRVSGDQIRNLPISNLGNALAGLVPGFYSRQKSGGILNAAPNYWIRGLRVDLPQQLEMMRKQTAGLSGSERIHGHGANLLDRV